MTDIQPFVDFSYEFRREPDARSTSPAPLHAAPMDPFMEVFNPKHYGMVRLRSWRNGRGPSDARCR